MRKLAIALFLLVFFSGPVGVHARESIHLASVSVDIWPEYDQPAVLVIERITLATDVSLPASLNLSVPADGQINAVAIVDASGQLVNAPFESSVEGNWSVLKITANSANLQVEYYQALVKDTATRSIKYEWPGGNAVDSVVVNFLLPSASTDLNIVPAPILHAPGNSGLENYVIHSESLSAGQPFTVNIEYQRSTDALAISGQPVQPVSVPSTTTPGRISMSIVLPWILGGIGVLLVVGGVVGFMAWRRGGSTPDKPFQKVVSSENSETAPVYCHECGNRAQPGDIFCRTCGARLRQL